MWSKIAEQVRERDKHRCYKCNCEANEVHHIIPKVYLTERIFLLKTYAFNSIDDSKNLITLCESCHKSTDNDFSNLGVTKRLLEMLRCAKYRTLNSLSIGTDNHRETTERNAFYTEKQAI